jgi:hypothetical protein
MALISLSDWLDRSGDSHAQALTEAELESVRIVIDEGGHRPPAPEGLQPREPLPQRWLRMWRRAFWRLRRQPSGPA